MVFKDFAHKVIELCVQHHFGSYLGLDYFTNLIKIRLDTPQKFNFKIMPKVVEIDICWHKSYENSFDKAFVCAENISINKLKLKNFSNFDFKKLKTLRLFKLSAESFNGIGQCCLLDKLELFDLNTINLEGISQCSNLRSLKIYRSKNLLNINDIYGLSVLKKLYLSDLPLIENLYLPESDSLNELIIGDLFEKELINLEYIHAGVNSCININNVSIYGNESKINDSDFFRKLENIQTFIFKSKMNVNLNYILSRATLQNVDIGGNVDFDLNLIVNNTELRFVNIITSSVNISSLVWYTNFHKLEKMFFNYEGNIFDINLDNLFKNNLINEIYISLNKPTKKLILLNELYDIAEKNNKRIEVDLYDYSKKKPIFNIKIFEILT